MSPNLSDKKKSIFSNISNLLLLIFSNQHIKQQQLNIQGHEKQLLQIVLKKKRLRFIASRLSDPGYISQIIKSPPPKKRETNLKYVIPKCLKHLRKKFVQMAEARADLSLFAKNKRKRDLDYDFYDHYFGDIARRENIKIERFFLYRNWTHRFSRSIPKSVTADSLELWKKNPLFIRHLLEYLRVGFWEDCFSLNKKKIRLLVVNWGKLCNGKKGIGQVVKEIKGCLLSRGGKLPWTYHEAKAAIDLTIDILS